MKKTPSLSAVCLGISASLLMGSGAALAAETGAPSAAQLEELRQQLADQTRRIDELKRAMATEEANLKDLRRALGSAALESQRGGADTSGGAQAAGSQGAVGQAPAGDGKAPEVATIFEQPGVLTPKGTAILEPSLQYSYSSSNRIALVGYTVIPAILIGVIDVREVKRTTLTGTLTGRYGLTNRMEVEARLPYVYRSDTSVGREFLTGASSDQAFDASAAGIGDVEVSARYQLNDGGVDTPYYVAGLRFKTRTGTDPFEVNTITSVTGLREGVQTDPPTGSGFYSLQPSLSVLYPSDPAVFFGTVSYTHNIKRKNVSALKDGVLEPIGDIAPGGIFGFNFGMGLALNERSSFSIGYDHNIVGRTKQNGKTSADSVRIQLGTLLLGYSYRLENKRSLGVSLGVGVTRDTPDMTLTVRMPFTL